MKKKEARLITLKCGNIDVTVDVNEFMNEDAIAPIAIEVITNDKKIKVLTGVVDENLRTIVPFRCSLVTCEELDVSYFENNVIVYQNKRAIYHAAKDEVYVIDLSNVTFKRIGNKVIPDNYLIKMDGYSIINDKCIIVYKDAFTTNGQSYIYNVDEDKKMSITYNYILVDPDEATKFYGGFVMDVNRYVNPLFVTIKINCDDGKPISNEVFLNKHYLDGAMLDDQIRLFLPKRIMGDKEKVIKYCDEHLCSYVKTMNKNKHDFIC